jgi:hypothetical protein
MDIDSLIAQTEALSWDDPSSQIANLSAETAQDECLPLVGHVISQKTHNNQSVFAALSKAWEFAVPFSFAVLGPNKYLFKLSKPEHLERIQKQVTWNVNGFLIILQKWLPHATLTELQLKKAPFWIQVHGLPLINMTTKTAISIGKALGDLIKVEESSSDKLTFRSFLRILVEIEVSKPLKPGFFFQRDGGESIWIFLKYERLDIYCASCGRIGHNHDHCLAPPVERLPEQYEVSLHVNIFSNLPKHFPVSKNHTSKASTSSQPSPSQLRSPELNRPQKDNLIPVQISQTPQVTCSLQQKISPSLVTSPHTPAAILGSKSTPSTESLLITSTSTAAYTAAPPQPLLLPNSQNETPVTKQLSSCLESNQNLSHPPTKQQPSLSIVLPFCSTPPHSLSSTSAHTFSQSTPTFTTKSPAKRPSSHSKKPSLPRNTLFPPASLNLKNPLLQVMTPP